MPSKIEWTDQTWNPVSGCSPISPGCNNCYAKALAHRLHGRCGYPKAPDHFNVTTHPDRLVQPVHWRKPRRVFVCSMGDLFHDDVPAEYIDKIFAVMALAPRHTFQLLTKRPARMKAYLEFRSTGKGPRYDDAPTWYRTLTDWLDEGAAGILGRHWDLCHAAAEGLDLTKPLPNVWLGVTAEDQKRADERMPLLLQCPAAVRFVSVEPMLGPVDLGQSSTERIGVGVCDGCGARNVQINAADGAPLAGGAMCRNCVPMIDWVIAGGESGHGARPTHPAWVRALRDRCAKADAPFFFKGWGAWAPGDNGDGIVDVIDLRGGSYPSAGNPSDVLRRALANGGEWMSCIGKHRSGRLLDGWKHDGMPQAST